MLLKKYIDDNTGKELSWKEKLNKILTSDRLIFENGELDILSKNDLKDLLEILNENDDEEIKNLSGSYFIILNRIKYFSSDILEKIKKESDDKPIKEFQENFKKVISHEKELIKELLINKNITGIEHQSKNFILGEIYGVIYMFLNSEMFQTDFKNEIKNKLPIKLEDILEQINKYSYSFDNEGNRTPLFEKYKDKKTKKEKYKFNHPSGNKLDILFIRKVENKYKFSYGMITTSNDSEIEKNTFYKHPMLISQLDNKLNFSNDKILSKEEEEKIMFEELKTMKYLIPDKISEFFQNLTSDKKNIDNFYKNIDGFFVYGGNILMSEKQTEETLTLNYITTGMFLAAQLLHKPEIEFEKNSENIDNLYYYLNKIQSTFFSNKNRPEELGFQENFMNHSLIFLDIIKEVSKIKKDKNFEKNKKQKLTEIFNENTENITLFKKFLNKVTKRKDIIPSVNNSINLFFNSKERIKLFENLISGLEKNDYDTFINLRGFIKQEKNDYDFSSTFRKEGQSLYKDKVLEEKDKVLEEKDKVLEEKDKVLKEKDKLLKEKEEEKYQEKKESFINLINMLKEEDIIKALNIKESDIQRLIKEGIINNKVIIEKYKSKEPERRKDNKKRKLMENKIIECYCESKLNKLNKNQDKLIKIEFFKLIEKEDILKGKEFKNQYENIKKESEFYLNISNLYELSINKHNKKLNKFSNIDIEEEKEKSNYQKMVENKIIELEKHSNFLIKNKRIKKEDKETFIKYLINEFKLLENKIFTEEELINLSNDYLNWKQNKKEKRNQIKSIDSDFSKCINDNFLNLLE